MKNNRNEHGQYNTFSYLNYEVRAYLTSYDHNNKSALGRIRNSIINALNEHATLPKLMVVVQDDDILKSLPNIEYRAAAQQIVEWLLREISRSLESYKEYLPKKSVRPNIPHLLWIAPPTHCNFPDLENYRREQYGKALEFAVTSYSNMSCLHMIKFWDHHDASAFLNEEKYKRFTANGLTNYWLSVDSAIRYWATAICPKIGKKEKFQKGERPFKKAEHNKYKWYNKNQNQRLPTPP